MSNLKNLRSKGQANFNQGHCGRRIASIAFGAILLGGSFFRQAWYVAAQTERQSRGGISSPIASRAGHPQGAVKVITGAEGSVVFINNVRHGTTDQSGELDLAYVRAGSFPIKVRTTGYADFHGEITIIAGAQRVLKIKQLPTHDEGLIDFQKAEALRDGRKDEEAVKEYQEAIRLKPTLVEARIGLARVLISLERLDEAETELREALRSLGPARAEATTVLANLRRTQGLYDESITDYRTA
ncbi:MAG TPA: tetratricopeptide repeat protein, partial [Blastocatellia bacterium]